MTWRCGTCRHRLWLSCSFCFVVLALYHATEPMNMIWYYFWSSQLSDTGNNRDVLLRYQTLEFVIIEWRKKSVYNVHQYDDRFWAEVHVIITKISTSTNIIIDISTSVANLPACHFQVFQAKTLGKLCQSFRLPLRDCLPSSCGHWRSHRCST